MPMARGRSLFSSNVFFVQHGWNGVCYSLGCKAKTKPYPNGGSGSILTRKRNILDSLRSASAIKRARWRKIILCAERSMCRWAVVSEPVGRMGRALLISLMALVSAGAQTVEIAPSQLNLVPLTGLGDDRYWQQLVVTLEADDAAPAMRPYRLSCQRASPLPTRMAIAPMQTRCESFMSRREEKHRAFMPRPLRALIALS